MIKAQVCLLDGYIIHHKILHYINKAHLFLSQQKRVDPEVKVVEPEERSAVPEPAEEPAKPMQVPELIISESEKKEEKVLKLEKLEEPMTQATEIKETPAQ